MTGQIEAPDSGAVSARLQELGFFPLHGARGGRGRGGVGTAALRPGRRAASRRVLAPARGAARGRDPPRPRPRDRRGGRRRPGFSRRDRPGAPQRGGGDEPRRRPGPPPAGLRRTLREHGAGGGGRRRARPDPQAPRGISRGVAADPRRRGLGAALPAVPQRLRGRSRDGADGLCRPAFRRGFRGHGGPAAGAHARADGRERVPAAFLVAARGRGRRCRARLWRWGPARRAGASGGTATCSNSRSPATWP